MSPDVFLFLLVPIVFYLVALCIYLFTQYKDEMSPVKKQAYISNAIIVGIIVLFLTPILVANLGLYGPKKLSKWIGKNFDPLIIGFSDKL